MHVLTQLTALAFAHAQGAKFISSELISQSGNATCRRNPPQWRAQHAFRLIKRTGNQIGSFLCQSRTHFDIVLQVPTILLALLPFDELLLQDTFLFEEPSTAKSIYSSMRQALTQKPSFIFCQEFLIPLHKVRCTKVHLTIDTILAIISSDYEDGSLFIPPPPKGADSLP